MLKINKDQTAEFFRIGSDDKPITLICSPLSNFLWEDFVRDTSPIVRYLHDRYNIRDLSRMGKEIFERLYNGDEVTWVTSEEDIALYMEAVQNEEDPELPMGFKPENAIWWHLMGELSQTPDWPMVLANSLGNQFNSGNTAVHILNRLSEMIQEMLEQMEHLLKPLFQKGEQLEKLRQQFKDAMNKGDNKKASQIRQEGQKIVKEINEALRQAMKDTQPGMSKVVEQAQNDANKKNQDISNLGGEESGDRSPNSNNLEEKRRIAECLRKDPELRKLSEKLGSLRQIWQTKKMEKEKKDTYENIVGVEFSNDVPRAMSTELALASASENTKALFAYRYSQKSLLCKDYQAHSHHVGRGPVILYVDTSQSMDSGDRDVWSKALSVVICETVTKDNRSVYINLFEACIQESYVFNPGDKHSDLLEFVTQNWKIGGGTSFENVLIHAEKNENYVKNADFLLITDGQSSVTDSTIQRMNLKRKALKAQWTTICIDSNVNQEVRRFSDEVYTVRMTDKDAGIDRIQDSIR